MSSKVEVNKRAVYVLGSLVCVASSAIGLFWGKVVFTADLIIYGKGVLQNV